MHAGRAVDRAAVARLLLEESLPERGFLREDVLAVRGLLLAEPLLACLHEEVGDVQHALLELLAEEVEEAIGVRRVGCELALQVLGEELREAHLDREEPRCGEARDEPAAGVPAEHGIRLHVAWVRNVAHPPCDRGRPGRTRFRPNPPRECRARVRRCGARPRGSRAPALDEIGELPRSVVSSGGTDWRPSSRMYPVIRARCRASCGSLGPSLTARGLAASHGPWKRFGGRNSAPGVVFQPRVDLRHRLGSVPGIA
jgi:hypothetical protein